MNINILNRFAFKRESDIIVKQSCISQSNPQGSGTKSRFRVHPSAIENRVIQCWLMRQLSAGVKELLPLIQKFISLQISRIQKIQPRNSILLDRGLIRVFS
jgi:hypothetical protein